MRIESANALQVVVKIAERCNINCTYCYMFNKGNDDFLTHPPYISDDTITNLIQFIKNGITTLSIKHVAIVFHGGEPLMMKKHRFNDMCQSITSALAPLTKLRLSIQTNAMLIDEEWLKIFEQYQIAIGVSLDGPAEYHDLSRVDHQDRGTHASTLAGLQMLQNAYQMKRISSPGAICVINPAFDAKRIYRHLVDDLGLHLLSFNLPMETHDSINRVDLSKLTKFVEDLFLEWVADDNPKIKIRLFDNMFRFFSGDKKFQDILPNFAQRNILAVIASNGDISENDDFKIIDFGQKCGNIKNTSLVEFANAPIRTYINEISQRMPTQCQTCDWQNYCLAGVSHGVTVSRFSKANGFANPSVFCETFQKLFTLGATYLLRNGLSVATLKSSLDTQSYQKTRMAPLPSPHPEFFSKSSPLTFVKQRN